MNDIQLSPNFKYSELTSTEHTDFIDQNQQEGLQFISSLTNLCEDLLEPIREQWGPLHINSGFRCVQLNNAVGSHSTSQHLLGQAADFFLVDKETQSLQAIWDWIAYSSNLDFHQLIFENGIWIHVALPLGVNDKQLMTYDIATKTYSHVLNSKVG